MQANDHNHPDPPVNFGRRILWISLGLVFAQVIGSLFNIYYNLTHIRPMLSELQADAFAKRIGIYNLVVYPIAVATWLYFLFSVARAWRCGKGCPETATWQRGVRRMINLPWIATAIGACAWLLSIPILIAAVRSTPDPLDPQVAVHLSVSIVIAALISMAQGFFIVEILTQRLLYPLFLSDSKSAQVPGTLLITLRRRGVIWVIASVFCPIVSLLLLFVLATPDGGLSNRVWFPLSVGAIGIVFGFVSAWLLARIVIEPVEVLRRSAQLVSAGDLDTHIDLLRTDEFGTLIDQFNEMVGGLREKQHVEEVLGRNVGLEVARHLLGSGENDLKGAERAITVMFTDIRGFTPRCARSEPVEVVTMLNIFFDGMVPEVEARGGIVNQFVGDGFMAIFGAIGDGQDSQDDHEDAAVAAGCAMLDELARVNRRLAGEGIDPLEIGIGLNSGPVVIGSIGASGRTSFTAVGDTVNVSARIESLTKLADYPLLMSASTFDGLGDKVDAVRLEPMQIKGKSKPITVYGIQCPTQREE